MIPWSDLQSTALLGTDRRPLPLDAEDPATALLDLAAIATVRQRAGARPDPAVEIPEPAAPDPRPELPTAASRRLALLLRDRQSSGAAVANLAELLPQWLATARDQGYRATPALVPELLDAARARSELRPDAVTLAGPLGGWLAERNHDWRYVSRTAVQGGQPQTTDQLWHEGLFAERVTHLTRLRRQDPAAARELLRSTWSTERAEDRLLFLDTLQEGLSPADEEFLESALTDRSKNCRAMAAELLSTLPGSALGQRMAERAKAAVRYQDGKLLVTPPAECDAGMQRDGIAPKSPTGRGERAWWLGEVIAATPLALWPQETGCTPAELLALPVKDGWTEDLHEGWARAAVRQGDADWARALLGQVPSSPRPGRQVVQKRQAERTAGAAAKLLAVLPPAERAAWTAGYIAGHGLGEAFQALGACAVPWTPPLSTAVVAALRRTAGSGGYPWSHSGVLGMTERALAPETATAVEELAAEAGADSPWAETFTRLAGTLRFREAMLAELLRPAA
ncbi:hypothetical protein CFP65_2876 [Kitasatospora sp. MMS16-BH015]|uniref:DUF5691 domain-containing protein n=1 Tax=Kitasatospora sp. MMS16-BH015 TaxID=2018025 RepID=UPI000CA28CC6|nr:DUF5691 domain-containing protein [Kitasatospora sp. MMS16-BH015]AUG77691.1 hypothetical protein CFP65_2876 [Kitasatospora sp. MMS16-BH015]